MTGGGVINMTTKSGTNRYNGLVYWYHRNPSLNAAPFTTSANNRPESNRRQHQFGLTLGGPIVLPKKIFGPAGYDGHNKSFFFVAYEPRYYYDGRQCTQFLPTPAMLRGDFSNVVRVNGGFAPRDVAERFGLQNQIADATIYNQWLVNGNLFTRRTLAAGETFPAFPDNKIPANMLDPLSQELLQFMPTAGEYFLSDGNLRNYVSENFIKNLEKRLTVRAGSSGQQRQPVERAVHASADSRRSWARRFPGRARRDQHRRHRLQLVETDSADRHAHLLAESGQ